ncbi:MAG: CU044_2847 family protein [Bryobacterales bacterium]
MTEITQFTLQGGGIVFVEAEQPAVQAGTGRERASMPETFLGKYLNPKDGTPVPLDDRVGPVVDALKEIREKLVGMTPDEITLKAGLKFTGSAGVVLAKYGAEASVSITLKWASDQKGK